MPCCGCSYHCHGAVHQSRVRNRNEEQATVIPADALRIGDGDEGRYGQKATNPLPYRNSKHLDDTRKHDELKHCQDNASGKENLPIARRP